MLIYCCPDLMFASKIRSTAESLDIPARPARNVEMLRKRLDRVEDGGLNDPVQGVIIDLGLGSAALEMICLAKSHTPAMPVVAYGSHVLVDQLEQARLAGADFVMSNGQFAATLPAVLERLAK